MSKNKPALAGHGIKQAEVSLIRSSAAKIRVMVKRILNKYGYPPDHQPR